jgi:putative DNA methylase
VNDDKRLIEDYLPIAAISAVASREKRQISGLHLWWARRPLVACRAAVYGALVPASQFVPTSGSDEKKKSLGRANAAKFVERLCQYPVAAAVVVDAKQHILEAHAERLTSDTRKKVTMEDILLGKAPRPKVLDMFAGGGAIPLEALRLGCDAYALDLNPVAHIIELSTLVYPQKYGKPDPTACGMTGPKNAKDKNTWGGLADEVRYWAEWVLSKAKAQIGDLYPLIPDPEHKGRKQTLQADYLTDRDTDDVPPGYLMPVAYLWTRTVICKNPNCKATVPLVRQTWLCKKDKHYVALKMTAPRGKKQVRFEVVEARSELGLGFDPAGFSKGGNATCPFCGTVADSDYVMQQGISKNTSAQIMAIVCRSANGRNKVYLSGETCDELSSMAPLGRRLTELESATGLQAPKEAVNPIRPSPNARGLSAVTRHGMVEFRDLFSQRQLVSLLTFTSIIRSSHEVIVDSGIPEPHAKAITTMLALVLDKLVDYNSCLCAWHSSNQQIMHTFARQALPMVWDYCEVNAFAGASGSWKSMLSSTCDVIPTCQETGSSVAEVRRGTAAKLPWPDGSVDVVVTDPPYYDNIPYADISDFFYVWLKQSVGQLYPEHFASELTPKKTEATALSSRHNGDMSSAREEYEQVMLKSFAEANRVLNSLGKLVVVYAHKTTLGWASLVEALRAAGFVVVEAWPLDTEMSSRLLAKETSALASNIFLVARKREGAETGNFEEAVKPELEQIVRERVETLWAMGISGADLVIACVGAGLRAFTRFAQVEYANGEQVPAERFLTEVETVVLETILARLSKEVGGNGAQSSLAGIDPATRFYVLWRYTYGAADLDAGEAIIFANGTHVELDGPHGLTGGNYALVQKKKSKYRLCDFADRGGDQSLGLTSDEGQPAPLVDALHRTLWLMEKRPTELAKFLREAEPNREQLRLVAQALAGPALKGGELDDISSTAELSALAKLTANWRSVVEDAAQTTGEKEERKKGQKQLI